MSLTGKKIILAITGSIAAYKTPALVRLLLKAGAEVRVLTTTAAESFVSPLALATVSKHPVLSSVHDGAAWNNHVELGLWADLMLVAPCSANTLAHLAGGFCNSLVQAVYLSARCPVFIAPAMDEDMWLHHATRRNIATLRVDGCHLIPVGHGELASGLVGEGRMAEPVEIVDYLIQFFSEALPLQGSKALVTAGPTYERLDPVRFIGNFSTGKMGIALAEALAARGAAVSLVLGPTALKPQNPAIRVIPVESARQMHETCMRLFPESNMAIMAAAVADYRPAKVSEQKIKKDGAALQLELSRTEDILASLGAVKKPGQLLAGFALETHNELEHARRKLSSKNADLMVLNSLQDAGAGFGHDTNKVTLLQPDGRMRQLPLQSKAAVAEAIVNQLLAMQHAQEPI